MNDWQREAVCWACGKHKKVNFYGFCEECWEKEKEK